MKNLMEDLGFRKFVISIVSIIVLIGIGIIAINIYDNSTPEEIITSKNEGDIYHISDDYEYDYQILNEKIKDQECFSYEEKITNKLYVTILNKSEKSFYNVDVYVIYYDKDKVVYVEKEDIYGGITPNSRCIVDLGLIPEKTTKHEIIVIPSSGNEKYKDMSDFIKTDIVKDDNSYYCRVENKSNEKIENCYVHMILYDKENNIIDIEKESFYNINSKNTRKNDIILLKDFDHYETIINAYNEEN